MLLLFFDIITNLKKRARVVDFTIPLYEDSTCILVPLSSLGAKSSMFAFLKPFDYSVWLCVFALVIIYSALFYLIRHLLHKSKNTEAIRNSTTTSSPSKSSTHNHNLHIFHFSWGNYLFFIFGKMLMEGLVWISFFEFKMSIFNWLFVFWKNNNNNNNKQRCQFKSWNRFA